MLTRYFYILKVIDFLEGLSPKEATGNQIAKRMKAFASRATIYRDLSRMIKAGLIIKTRYEFGDSYDIVGKGYDYMEAFNELPF